MSAETEAKATLELRAREAEVRRLREWVRSRGLRYGERFVYTQKRGSHLRPRGLVGLLGLWFQVSEMEGVDGLRWWEKSGMISNPKGASGLPKEKR